MRLNKYMHAGMTFAEAAAARRADREANAVANAAKKAARLRAVMHCQCCGRGILANNGKIAHHGYERPGTGWQTASCMGARHVPFEVSRDRLGDMIESLRHHEIHLCAYRARVVNEEVALSYDYTTRGRYGHRINHSVDVTRDIFEGFAEAYRRELYAGIYKFDDMKARELASVDSKIKMTRETIKECEKRYDGWKKTHAFDKPTKEWRTI